MKFILWKLFLSSVSLIISADTTTTTTLPVKVLCSRSLPITMAVTMTPTSVGLAASGQCYIYMLQP